MIKLLLVGSGRWGQRYITTLASFTNISLQVGNRHNWKTLIEERPSGVIICTPPSAHIEIAKYALRKKIPVMIEKPLSLSLQEAEVLKDYSSPILVNHIHLFSNTFQELKRQAAAGKISYIRSRGYGKGPQRDYSGLWDYGPHDLSMILDIAGSFPKHISVKIVRSVEAGMLYEITMQFESFETSSIVGNGADQRCCDILVGFDGVAQRYDALDRRADIVPPLTSALKVFIDAIQGGDDPRLGLDLPLKVIQVLESCQRALDSKRQVEM